MPKATDISAALALHHHVMLGLHFYEIKFFKKQGFDSSSLSHHGLQGALVLAGSSRWQYWKGQQLSITTVSLQILAIRAQPSQLQRPSHALPGSPHLRPHPAESLSAQSRGEPIAALIVLSP